MASNSTFPDGGRETSTVRDLRGEDLAALLPHSPTARIRFLVEAADALARAGDGDVVAVGQGGQVCAAAAAGYRTPFGDATVVLTSGRDAVVDLRRLLATLELRSIARRCLGLVGAVDAPDLPGRRLLESLGYEISGAGVVAWTEETRVGLPAHHVDVWRLRKTISGPGGTLPPGTPDEEDTCSSD
ncbi:hypothetical protein GCM10023201_34240 [Actinomycetospora corticicola]|uniref:Uncharacterized protein n=1 Tax=Actinomycetospora corticicola TaxID=663602 RepID=A0A7Y9E0F3_9PSEU|nr:hypothetical protein [Actinomycetospora corticicola]NYD38816.1 hypothetical protein [Actinomycetospora corticicola]